MGEKNIEIKSATLYLNNEPIMELDRELICEPPIYADEVPKVIKFSETQEVTFELENSIEIDRNTLLSLQFGRNVTNNWLKKQGGVMNRKERRKREKRNG